MKLMRLPILITDSGNNRRHPVGKKHGWRGPMPPLDAELQLRSERRLAKSPFITNSFEVHRLRQKLAELERDILRSVNGERARLQQMKSDCLKAIATMALLPDTKP